MVTTRSGGNVRRYGVRFKKGAAVRRILEFDNSGDYDIFETTNDIEGVTAKENGGILLNGTNHKSADYEYEQLGHEEEDSNKSILYDLNEKERRYMGSLLCDTLLFICITLLCYAASSLIYTYWGYKLYLAVVTLCIVMFSYNVTYFDSEKPGVMPPSPISPALYRSISGHTYHLGYVMSVVNGLVFLLIEPYLLNVVVPSV